MWAIRVLLSFVMATGVSFAQGGRGGDQSPKASSETPVPGNPAHGEAIFKGQGGCLSCHRVLDDGSRLGPDLSDVGSRLAVDALRASLIEPNPEVQSQYRSYRVITRDGTVITGKLLNQDQFSLQMLDSNEKLRAFQKSDLREYNFVKTAPMPSYQGKLSPEELTDLIAYLASLKGPAKQ